MATYQRIPLAGNTAGQNVFSVKTDTDQSDVPRLTAWDDYTMSTTSKESLAGTAVNGYKSFLCAASTHAGATSNGWASGLAQSAGGATTNRLKGDASYVLLGTTAPSGNTRRTFQFAMEVPSDATPGTTGHDVVLGFKIYYTTQTPPTVTFEVNTAESETANWVQVNLQVKGTQTLPSLPNCVYSTGPDSTTSALDPVTKPETGSKFAEQYWIQTA